MEESQVQEQAPETKVVGKKVKSSGDLILDVASEVESLSKAKALALAENLADNIETNYLKLGGVLNRIYEQSWFEGYEDFDSYVFEKFGFKGRKARYLIGIYTYMVGNSIPWDVVAPIGWTKLKDIVEASQRADFNDKLTADNAEAWAAKAAGLTVLELQAALKAAPTGEGETSSKTTSDIVKMKFDFKGDQAETVQQAMNKAKAEVGTEFDTVAIENIAAGYLAGHSGVAATGNQDATVAYMKEIGWEESLKLYASVFPGVDISVESVHGDGTVEVAAETN